MATLLLTFKKRQLQHDMDEDDDMDEDYILMTFTEDPSDHLFFFMGTSRANEKRHPKKDIGKLIYALHYLVTGFDKWTVTEKIRFTTGKDTYAFIEGTMKTCHPGPCYLTERVISFLEMKCPVMDALGHFDKKHYDKMWKENNPDSE